MYLARRAVAAPHNTILWPLDIAHSAPSNQVLRLNAMDNGAGATLGRTSGSSSPYTLGRGSKTSPGQKGKGSHISTMKSLGLLHDLKVGCIWCGRRNQSSGNGNQTRKGSEICALACSTQTLRMRLALHHHATPGTD